VTLVRGVQAKEGRNQGGCLWDLVRLGEGKPVFLTESEGHILLAGGLPHDQPLYALLYSNGLRPGEALHLRWDEIDFERESVHVCAKEGGSQRPTTSCSTAASGASAVLGTPQANGKLGVRGRQRHSS
jgi:integrase